MFLKYRYIAIELTFSPLYVPNSLSILSSLSTLFLAKTRSYEYRQPMVIMSLYLQVLNLRGGHLFPSKCPLDYDRIQRVFWCCGGYMPQKAFYDFWSAKNRKSCFLFLQKPPMSFQVKSEHRSGAFGGHQSAWSMDLNIRRFCTCRKSRNGSQADTKDCPIQDITFTVHKNYCVFKWCFTTGVQKLIRNWNWCGYP